MKLTRREFLHGAAAFSALPFLGGHSTAQTLESPARTVVHIFLEGGPDFRHLLAPPPGSAYGNAFWKARASLFEADPDDSIEHQDIFDQHYDLLTINSTTFGILKKAAWLRDKISAGKVAIFNNVLGSSSRGHPHSTLVWTSGDHAALPQELCRSGWGGRLAPFGPAGFVVSGAGRLNPS